MQEPARVAVAGPQVTDVPGALRGPRPTPQHDASQDVCRVTISFQIL